MTSGNPDDRTAMNRRRGAPRHDQPSVRGAREGREASLNLGRVADVNRAKLHAERRRHRLYGGPLADPARDAGIAKDCRTRHARRDLLEQFQPFRTEAILEADETSGIAAGSR